ncbi:MAG TPA: hypothetical protein VHM91_16660 [Verrucomicrobiales bacterium]|nr:hypothetical protein [Verrucomicrobiales bacterium]
MRLLPLLLLSPLTAMGQRINHEGRILGDVPVVTEPLLFNTPAADAVVSAMQIMPKDNAWNEDISQLSPLGNSDAMIARVKADLAVNTGRQKLRLFTEMNYALVPDKQPAQPITFFSYPHESDLEGGTSPVGLYPIPSILPVESWPAETGSLTNAEWQLDVNGDGGDRHAIMVKPGAGFVWETWQTKRTANGWRAANGAKFNLNANTLRPAGWTSADAAGLAMFPALVRYDECQRGMVEHALRLIVKHTRTGPIYPATHEASDPETDDPDTPAMGQRFRLKAGYAIPDNWTIQEKAVLKALKKYGAIVADNGNFFSVSITPDDRYPEDCFAHIQNTIDINQFEVIQTTGATGGPRSAGAPSANAGADQWAALTGTGVTLSLAGAVAAPGAVTTAWKRYSGPSNVTFANAASPATTATFTAPGTYTLMLSATDGVHAVAYDAAVITVTLNPVVSTAGNDIRVAFPSQTGHHYRVQKSSDMTNWQTLQDNLNGNNGTLTVTDANALSSPGKRQLYRVVVLD